MNKKIRLGRRKFGRASLALDDGRNHPTVYPSIYTAKINNFISKKNIYINVSCINANSFVDLFDNIYY